MWKMIVDTGSTIVVMVTNLIEGGRVSDYYTTVFQNSQLTAVGFCHYPIDFRVHSRSLPPTPAHSRSLPLTPAYSRMCWWPHIDGRMIKAQLSTNNNQTTTVNSNSFVANKWAWMKHKPSCNLLWMVWICVYAKLRSKLDAARLINEWIGNCRSWLGDN